MEQRLRENRGLLSLSPFHTVYLMDARLHLDNIDIITQEVKKLVQSKKMAGFPIRTLHFSRRSLSSDLMAWFTKEVDCFQVIRHYEDEFRWMHHGR